jgi:hypothetical protein
VLRKQIGRVHFTGHLAEVYAAEADRLLNPQGVGIKVS